MLKRTKPLARGPLPRSRDRIRRVGKQGLANAKALRVFKREMARLSIDRCELRFKDCTGDYFLTWAHGRKRNKLLPGELETFAVIACAVCHRVLDEDMSHAEMAAKVSEIIEGRAARPAGEAA